MKRILISVFILVGIFCSQPSIFAASFQSGSNLLLFNDDIASDKVVEGDIYAFGGTIKITGNAGGDIIGFGNELVIESDVIGGNIRAVGNRLDIKSQQVRNITAAGNLISISDDTTVEEIYAAGNQIEFLGKAEEVKLAGNYIFVDGEITGDLDVRCHVLTLGENAKINGRISVVSEEVPRILGNINPDQIDFKSVDSQLFFTLGTGFFGVTYLVLKVIGIVTALAITLFVILIAKPYIMSLEKQLIQKTYIPFLIGFGVFIGMPIASVLMMITVIGLPVGIILLLMYIILIYLSTILFGITVGKIVLKEQNIYIAGLVGVIALKLLSCIPWVGGIIGFASVLFTFGTLVGHFIYRKQL